MSDPTHVLIDLGDGTAYAQRLPPQNASETPLSPIERAVLALAAERDRLLAVLRSVEWEGNSTDGYGDPCPHCPACDGRKVRGHKGGCALAAALKGG